MGALLLIVLLFLGAIHLVSMFDYELFGIDNHRMAKHSSLKQNTPSLKQHRSNIGEDFIDYIYSTFNRANLTSVTNRRSILLANKPNQQQDRDYEIYPNAESFALTFKNKSRNKKLMYSDTSPDLNKFDYKLIKASKKKTTFRTQLLQSQTNILTNSQESIRIPDSDIHGANIFYENSAYMSPLLKGGTGIPHRREILGLNYPSDSSILRRNPSFLGEELSVRARNLRPKIPPQPKSKFITNKGPQLLLGPNLPEARITPLSSPLQNDLKKFNINVNTQRPPEIFNPEPIGGQFERVRTPLQYNARKSYVKYMENQNSQEPQKIFNANQPGVHFRSEPRLLQYYNLSKYDMQYMPNNKGPRVLIKPNLPRERFERVSPAVNYNLYQSKVLYIVPNLRTLNVNPPAGQVRPMRKLQFKPSQSDVKYVVNQNTQTPQKVFNQKLLGVHVRSDHLFRHSSSHYDIQYMPNNKGPRGLIKPNLPRFQFETVSPTLQYNPHQSKVLYVPNQHPFLNLPDKRVRPVPILQNKKNQFNVKYSENQNTEKPRKLLNPKHHAVQFRSDHLLQFNRSQYDLKYMPSNKGPRVLINSNEPSVHFERAASPVQYNENQMYVPNQHTQIPSKLQFDLPKLFDPKQHTAISLQQHLMPAKVETQPLLRVQNYSIYSHRDQPLRESFNSNLHQHPFISNQQTLQNAGGTMESMKTSTTIGWKKDSLLPLVFWI